MPIITLFFKWYFVDLPQKIYQIWVNYLWFFRNYFALSELLKSLFAPWKGVHFRKRTIGFEIGEAFGNFVFNIFSRMIGFIIRTFFLLIGGVAEIFTACCGVVMFIFWITFPFFLGFCLVQGIQLV